MVPNDIEDGKTISGLIAVPVTLTDCGLPVPVYTTEMLPVCVPVAVELGENLTLTLQEAPAASVPHAVAENSVLVLETVTGTAVVELFFKVIVWMPLVEPWATEPKASDAGAIVTVSIPVPDRAMVCVAGEALSLITTLPVRVPRAVGVKVMVIRQLLPAATEVPQVLVSAKLPVDTILVILSAVVVLTLWSVIAWPALVEPTATLPNEYEVEDKLTTGGTAATDSMARSTSRKATRKRRVGICQERNRSIIELSTFNDSSTLQPA